MTKYYSINNLEVELFDKIKIFIMEYQNLGLSGNDCLQVLGSIIVASLVSTELSGKEKIEEFEILFESIRKSLKEFINK